MQSTSVRVAAIAAGLLAAAACGGSDSAASPSTSAAPRPTSTVEQKTAETSTTVAVSPVIIGLVTPSAVDDASFTQSMVDSLARLAADRPIEIDVAADLPSPDDAVPAAEAFAADGADIVIVHGSQYRRVIEQVAGDHPDVAFAWGTEADDVGLPNVFSYAAAADEGGYVNGVIGAGLSVSRAIGVIGPIQIGDAALYVDGFQAGAVATDPSVTVNVSFLDSYTDAALAGEAAAVMTAFGADVLSSTSQISGGVLTHAESLGLPFLGTQASAIDAASTVVVAAQLYHWEIALEEMFSVIEEGGNGVALEPLTLANGGLTIEFNDAYELPEPVRAAADAAIAGLIEGSIHTGLG
ncbi:MAG: BMP family ABC transporter substrate-binding protein [Acidimicrobiia bacterium]|nr:BMP family ABC transporter substrate-binding protein [Acidimicrobiia bacterium]